MSDRSVQHLFDPEDLVGELPDHVAAMVPTIVTADSRLVIPGALYVAVPGERQDGLSFLDEVIQRGAVAVATERPAAVLGPEIAVLHVQSARRALARAVSRSHGVPSRALQCIGVTGTNGKTSVTWMLAQILYRLSGPTMLVGTLGAGICREGESIPQFVDLGNTTPGAERVHGLLHDAVERGATAAVLEVTSIGLVQHRTTDIHWDAAVFTNLTRDHLDVHGSMEAYGAAKRLLFTTELALSEKSRKIAILNIDDPFCEQLSRGLDRCGGVLSITYSMVDARADVFPLAIEPSFTGTMLRLKIFGHEHSVSTRFVGGFNVSNTLAAIATTVALGYEPVDVLRTFAEVPPVPGRLEVIPVGDVRCVIDYAHTPDGLVQAQRSLREVTPGKLITVFGCGGDRDRGKRPLMGEAVARLSDCAIVTSDNPRSEHPERIIDDVLPGLTSAAAAPGFTWWREADRQSAIRRAVELAAPGDTVLIAGKGHEDYQEVAGVRHPFSDQEECRKLSGSASSVVKTS